VITIIYLSPAATQAVLSQQLPPQREQGSVMSMDTSTAVRNANANASASATVPSWDNTYVQGQLYIILAISIKLSITCGENYKF
jgi:hypothetical protein